MVKRKIEIIVVLLALIGLGLSYIFLNTVESYKYKNDCIYFINGIEYDIPAGSEAKINDDGSITIKTDEADIDVYSLPVYERDYNKIILTEDLAYLKPVDDGKFEKSKLIQLTEVEYDASTGEVCFEKNSKKAIETDGILYDGHNTYIFLENMRISFNDKTIDLAPLSYANVVNDTCVEVYSKGTNKYYYELTNEEVFATNRNQSYVVNLATDVVDYYGNETMLNAGFSLLVDYFKEN